MSLLNDDLGPAEAAERRKSIVLRIVRAAFVVLMITFSLLAALQQQQSDKRLFLSDTRGWMPVIAAVSVSFILIAVAIAVDLATPKKKVSTITGVIFGILAGVLATAALGFIIDLLLESWVQNRDAMDVLRPVANSVKVLIGITLSYIGVTTVLQTEDDFRLVIPYVEFAKQIRGVKPFLIDTSVLIDGRLADIASTGFLQAPLLIPRFVVNELQILADSADALKRTKGRRGLEYTSRLQRTPRLDVMVDETPVPGIGVDQMLVELARTMPAIIVTTDGALAQVAKINGIAVLNLNDLANALKSAFVPGESFRVQLIRQGEQPNQAVGYLPDGAMVVAEDGASAIGRDVELVVTSTLQTSAGRLIFAKLGPGNPPEAQSSDTASVPAPASTRPADETSASSEPTSASPEDADEQPPAPAASRGPFPPAKVFRPARSGTPRNPRR
jgi:uncharacterized protein YacL